MRDWTDEQVMLAYKKGDGGAMDELFRRYRNPVFHFACRVCRNEAQAQDVAQDVFLRVHQARATYVPSGKFSTWIFAIAHNLLVSQFRRQRRWAPWPRRGDDLDRCAEFPSLTPSPADEAVRTEEATLVRDAIQGLPFLQKEAIVLREYHRLDYAEISRILNKPAGTVKTLIYRARMALKEKLHAVIRDTQGGRHGEPSH